MFKQKFTDRHQGENWTDSFRQLSEGCDSSDPQKIVRSYLEVFAFENGGDLSEFKDKKKNFINLHMVN
jgi:hypothetical protein